jgi:myo-inositol-1(or 4)-monophosphatase
METFLGYDMKRIEKSLKTGPRSDLADVVKIAAEAALQAGRILLDLYGKPHDIRQKGTIDLVTEADVAAERAILDILEKAQSKGEILAEESRSTYDTVPQGPLWIIDPLDGTTNYAHGFPWFCVSIGFFNAGDCEAGVIYCPMLDELFHAFRGNGAWLNGERIRVSSTAGIGTSLLATGFPYDIQQNPKQIIAALQAVLTRCQGVRRAGAAAIDLAYVACGRIDGFWETKLKPWDTAAGKILVEEAGGITSDFKGATYSPFVSEIAASNGAIHSELIALLKQFSQT